MQQWKTVLPIVVGLFYGVSPLDLIPDVIPFVGLLDDAVIVPTLILLGVMHYRSVKRKAIPIRTRA